MEFFRPIILMGKGDGKDPLSGWFVTRTGFVLIGILALGANFLLTSLVLSLLETPVVHQGVGKAVAHARSLFRPLHEATAAVALPIASAPLPEDLFPTMRQLASGRDSRALLEFTSAAMASGTHDARILQGRMQALFDLGQPVEAARILTEYLQRYPNDPGILVVGGSFHNAMGNPLVAEKLYQKALLIDRTNLPAIRGLSLTWMRNGVLDPALELLETGLQAHASDAILLMTQSLTAFRQGNRSLAWKAGQGYLAVAGSDSAELRYILASCVPDGEDRVRRVEEEYRRGLDLQASHVPTLNDYAGLLGETGQASRALPLIEPLLKHSKRAGFALDTAGETLLRLGQLEEAKRLLQEAAAKEPGHPAIALRLATLFKRQGRTDDGRKWLAKAIENCLGDKNLVSRIEAEYARE